MYQTSGPNQDYSINPLSYYSDDLYKAAEKNYTSYLMPLSNEAIYYVPEIQNTSKRSPDERIFNSKVKQIKLMQNEDILNNTSQNQELIIASQVFNSFANLTSSQQSSHGLKRNSLKKYQDSDETLSGLYNESLSKKTNFQDFYSCESTPQRSSSMKEAKKKISFYKNSAQNYSNNFQSNNWSMNNQLNSNFSKQKITTETESLSYESSEFTDYSTASSIKKYNNFYLKENESLNMKEQNINQVQSQVEIFNTPASSIFLTQEKNCDASMFPPALLLTNQCCEYDLSHVNSDLKPLKKNFFTSTNENLKDEFDQIIPPNQKLTDFFSAPDKSIEDIAESIDKKVTAILNYLDNDS